MENSTPMARSCQEKTNDDIILMADAQHVVADPNASVADFVRLARNSSSDVRKIVAGSESTPPRLLSHLLEDSVRAVALTAASNPSTPSRALARELVKDHAHHDMELALVANPSTPDKAKRWVLETPHLSEVKVSAFLALNQPSDLFLTLSTSVRKLLIEDERTTTATLCLIAESGELRRFEHLSALANHPNTDASVLRSLARLLHDDPTAGDLNCNYTEGHRRKVLSTVITNPNTPTEVLRLLAELEEVPAVELITNAPHLDYAYLGSATHNAFLRKYGSNDPREVISLLAYACERPAIVGYHSYSTIKTLVEMRLKDFEQRELLSMLSTDAATEWDNLPRSTAVECVVAVFSFAIDVWRAEQTGKSRFECDPPETIFDSSGVMKVKQSSVVHSGLLDTSTLYALSLHPERLVARLAEQTNRKLEQDLARIRHEHGLD